MLFPKLFSIWQPLELRVLANLLISYHIWATAWEQRNSLNFSLFHLKQKGSLLKLILSLLRSLNPFFSTEFYKRDRDITLQSPYMKQFTKFLPEAGRAESWKGNGSFRISDNSESEPLPGFDVNAETLVVMVLVGTTSSETNRKNHITLATFQIYLALHRHTKRRVARTFLKNQIQKPISRSNQII